MVFQVQLEENIIPNSIRIVSIGRLGFSLHFPPTRKNFKNEKAEKSCVKLFAYENRNLLELTASICQSAIHASYSCALDSSNNWFLLCFWSLHAILASSFENESRLFCRMMRSLSASLARLLHCCTISESRICMIFTTVQYFSL